ncbi:MAG: inositol phosphorylceramide synthase [Deltaproteobacteria bacterium]|nr:inositol phosphorylceramide synthase [Deltaproteobacteria bacterium]
MAQDLTENARARSTSELALPPGAGVEAPDTGILERAVAGYVEWWRGLSVFQKTFPAASVAVYWLSLKALGGFRPDHAFVGVLALSLSYGGRQARVFLGFLLPLILTGIVYDSQRFYSDYLRAQVRVSEPYLFDKTFFGIPTAAGTLTPNEWWQLHAHPVLDFVTGFFYLTFVAIFVLIAAYFRFWHTRKSRSENSSIALRACNRSLRSRVPMWAFFWLNVLGYTTYYWYPAAPPWYVAMHGLGPAKMDVAANAAGCLRFDALLGTHFFTGMYGRSADVFGAIPSLHVAYPLLAVLFAFEFGAARIFSIFFFLMMCFSAVYLNHHYVLDILWGSAYTVLVYVIFKRVGTGSAGSRLR